MPPANTDTLLTLIESADPQGIVHLHPYDKAPLRGRDAAREALLTELCTCRLALLRLELVKKSIEEVDLAWENTPNGPVISVNLAKLFLLPGLEPARELAEFKELLVAMRDFLQANATQRRDIQVCNHRNTHRRVYGTVSCRVPDGEQKMAEDEAATKQLRALVTASPALTHWLRQVALTLSKMGPWSWTCIREEELFGYSEGPYINHLRRQREAAKAASATEASV